MGWPSGASAKKWEVIDLESGSATSADVNVFCCKRAAQKCDKCDPSTCATILPLACNPFTKLLHPCCMWYSESFGGECICQGVEDVCDHSDDSQLFPPISNITAM